MNKLKLFFGMVLLAGLSLSANAQMNVMGTVQSNQIPNLAASATTDTTNAANISSGTLSYLRIPIGTTSTSVAAGNDSRFLNATSINGTLITSLTGVIKFTNGTPSAVAYGDIVGLFGSGTCSGFLKSDGTCGAGGTTYTAGTGITIATSTISTANTIPIWQKVTIGYSTLNAAATTQAVTLVTLAAGQKVCGLSEKHTTAFAGTGITALTVTVGDSNGTATTYSNNAFNLLQAVSNTAFQDTTVFGSASYAGGNVQANFTSTGGNLSALTAGSVNFEVCVVTMP